MMAPKLTYSSRYFSMAHSHQHISSVYLAEMLLLAFPLNGNEKEMNRYNYHTLNKKGVVLTLHRLDNFVKLA